jgi:hypothetical protein
VSLAVDRIGPRGPLGLWLALLAGPTAASLQLSINYALVKWACANGGEWVLTAVAVTLLAIALGGAVLGGVHLTGVREEHAVARVWSADSRRLLAATAIGVDLLIAVFLVNTLIALAALTPCE